MSEDLKVLIQDREEWKTRAEKAEAQLDKHRKERSVVEARHKDQIELLKIRNKGLEDDLRKANVDLACKGLGSDVDQILKRGKLVAEREELKAQLSEAQAKVKQLDRLNKIMLKKISDSAIKYIDEVSKGQTLEAQLAEAQKRVEELEDGNEDLKLKLMKERDRVKELELAERILWQAIAGKPCEYSQVVQNRGLKYLTERNLLDNPEAGESN